MNIKLLIFSVITILILFTSVCIGSTSKYDLPENQEKLEKLEKIGWGSFAAIFFIALFLNKPKLDENKYDNRPNPDQIFIEEGYKQLSTDRSNKSDVIILFFTLIVPLAILFFLFWSTNLTNIAIVFLLVIVSFILMLIGQIHYILQRDRRHKNALKITLEKTDGLRPTCCPEFTPKMFVYTLIIFIIMFLVLDRYYFTPLT